MITTNNWELPQKFDSYNPEGRDWSDRIFDFMQKYASVINGSTGKFTISATSPSTDFFTVIASDGSVFATFDSTAKVLRLSGTSASHVLVTDSQNNLSSSTVTTSELGNLLGVSANVQNQLNSKINTSTSAQFSISAHNHDGRYPLVIHSQPWSTISATPSTLGGYGITDAIPLTSTNSFAISGHGHNIATSIQNGFLLSADWSRFNASTSGFVQTPIVSADLSATPSSVITVVGGTKSVLGVGVRLSASQATQATNGFVLSSDYTKWNNKLDSATSAQFSMSAHNHDSRYAQLDHDQPWSTISATPSTLGGYGITDAIPLTSANSFAVSGHGHNIATATQNGFLLSADWLRFNSSTSGYTPLSITSADLSATPSSVITVVGGAKSVLGVGVGISASQVTQISNGFVLSSDYTKWNNKLDSATSAQFSTSAHNHDGRYATSVHSQPWSTISATPSTLGGYGITDAIPKTSANSFAVSGHGHNIATATQNGFLLSADWSRFDASTSGYTPSSITSADLSATPYSIITVVGGVKSVLGVGVQLSASQASQVTNGFVLSSDYIKWDNKLDSVTSAQFSISAHNHDGRYATSVHNQPWSTISATPSTLGGYGITDAIPKTSANSFAVSGHGHSTATSSQNGFLLSADWLLFNNKLNSTTSAQFSMSAHNHDSRYAQLVHGHPWSTISATPSTLGGYGITDAIPTASANSFAISGHSHSTATATQNGFLLSADWSRFNASTSGYTPSSITSADLSATPSSVITVVGGVKSVLGVGVRLSASQASQVTNGFVLSSDYTKWNNKLDTATSAQFSISAHNHDSRYAQLDHDQPWSTISATPSTLGGYGITDAIPKTSANSFAVSGHSHTTATASSNGFVLSSDYTKWNNKLDTATSAQFSLSGHGHAVGNATNNGYILSSDWASFNNKLSSVSTSALTDITSVKPVDKQLLIYSSSTNEYTPAKVQYANYQTGMIDVAPTSTATWDVSQFDSMNANLSASTGSVTITLVNPSIGGKYQLRTVQHPSSAKTLSLAVSGYTIKTPSGSGYAISTSVGAVDLISMAIMSKNELLVVTNKAFS